MKVLIIGDYPGFYGGVTNYTRPLAEELSRSNDVYYLYSCTRTLNYDFFGMRIIKTVPIENSNVNYYELLNSPTRYFNYNNLSLDYENWIDNVFNIFLNEINPDVLHIHEIFGLSSNIISIAKKRGIKVFVTVHEYWWLCPHRVMVDFNKKICEGPTDINKCAHCVMKQNYSPQSRIRIIVRKNMKWVHTFYLKFFKKEESKIIKSVLDFGEELTPVVQNLDLYNQIENRLKVNITKLNDCDKIIGVSRDVKNILSRHGVNPNNIIVNHIGSTIANNKIIHYKKVNPEKIVFGFIGGVGYYKGVHQLVRAFLDLSIENKERAEVLIYGKYDFEYFKAMNEEISRDLNSKYKIKFLGKYEPKDLVNITNSIDISVLPSICADTAPQTIFESFSAGLPIIAPKIGGFPDFVLNDINGLLYEATSVNDLKIQLELIINQPDLLDKFKLNINNSKAIDENIVELTNLYSNLN